ncbi:MAG: hypothetical protein HY328_03990 [Chloroflexi bacterium]|nr:hypothetical protein [Chloroflexota bacterium]
MNRSSNRYHSYLLRIWREESAVPMHWRISLTSADSSERLGFPTLEAAFLFLRGQMQHWENKDGTPNFLDTGNDGDDIADSVEGAGNPDREGGQYEIERI